MTWRHIVPKWGPHLNYVEVSGPVRSQNGDARLNQLELAGRRKITNFAFFPNMVEAVKRGVGMGICTFEVPLK